MKNKNQKVFVGVSGGVDSSVAALLLKKQGYDVTGVFIKAWYPDFIPCDWRSEMRDAMRVCAQLEIPFLLCDLEKEYKKYVIDYLIDEYRSGRTPNPDVMCNKHVKFDGFLNFALEKGSDYIATGHYADKEKVGNSYRLIKPADAEKDQTYFLWTLSSEQLEKSLFPLGKLRKDEVRKIAKKNKLWTSAKKDSQGLCFIGHIDLQKFLAHYIDMVPGAVLNEAGEKIGTHRGAIIYTLGERRGFTIDTANNTRTEHYVIDKDIEKNTITVSTKIKPQGDTFKLIRANLTGSIEKGSKMQAQLRYRGKMYTVVIESTPISGQNNIEVRFLNLENDAPAKGQSIVLYNQRECLGGGIVA